MRSPRAVTVDRTRRRVPAVSVSSGGRAFDFPRRSCLATDLSFTDCLCGVSLHYAVGIHLVRHGRSHEAGLDSRGGR